MENHRFVLIKEDAVLQVILDRTGKRDGFRVTSHGDQVFRAIGMVNALNFLIDNRAFIKVRGHVVRGGTNQFDASRMCLMIRLGPLEPR